MKINLFGFTSVALLFIILNSCSTETIEQDSKEEKLNPLVNIEEAKIKPFIHEIRVQGNVETDKDILMSAEMGGLITSINVKEGQTVQAGQTIAIVDASVLSSNLEELKTQLDYAEYILNKQKELSRKDVGSEFELQTAQNQVESLKSRINSINVQRGKAIIKAPFTGVIDHVFARSGQIAGPQSPIVRLVNNSIVNITASISEKHLSNVHIGTPIRVSFPNFRDTSIYLKITSVGNYIEPTNRTFRIMSTIHKNTLLLPNMLAEISITDLNIDNGLVIPSKAILKDKDNNDYVFIATKIKEGYKVIKSNVTVLEKYEGEALIKQGENLKKGGLVVLEGAKGITDNDIVTIK